MRGRLRSARRRQAHPGARTGRPDPPRSAGRSAHLPPRRTPPARRRGMDPPLRTLLQPEARCPRGPASHRRRPPRQDRSARRPPRAQQEEEEEMNETIPPAEADYAVLSDNEHVHLPNGREPVCTPATNATYV